jgi:hypothetical protein
VEEAALSDAPSPRRLLVLALLLIVLGTWLILRDNPFGEAPLRGIGAVLLGLSVLTERARWRRSDLVFGAGVVCVAVGYAWRYGDLLVRAVRDIF